MKEQGGIAMWDHPSVQFRQIDKIQSVSASRLSDSHERCKRMGVKHELTAATDMLQGKELNAFLDQHQLLALSANSLFIDTFHHLHDQKMLFILTDGEARVIELFSKPEVLALAAARGIVAGASLSEKSLGTNAVSLALHHAELVVLRGSQHFCQIFADWYCVSVPIIIDGKAVACLDISTCHEETLGDKLALANLLATELRSFINSKVDSIKNRNSLTQAAAQISTLTVRQKQVLVLFSQGLGYKEIAKKLEIRSCKTIEKHLDLIRTKLAVKTRRECIQKGIEMGLL